MSAERVWLKSYPAGVPADIDPDRYPSVPAMLEESFARFADLPAYSNFGHAVSYAEIDRMSRAMAAYLQGLPDMARGDRVAIMMPNLIQYPVALFGALRAGFVVVNVNPLYTPRELEFQLKDSGAKAILIVENFARTLQLAMKGSHIRHVVTTQLGDLLPLPKRSVVNFVVKRVKRLVPRWRIPGTVTLRHALSRGAGLPFTKAGIGGSDVAFLQYTGGTTGVSKAAMLTHRNLVANLEQASAWVRSEIVDGEEVVISPLPMYHAFCLTVSLAVAKWGCLNVLITNPRDMKGFVKELGNWKFTLITGVNTLFNGLLNTPGFDALDFSKLKVSLGGGAAVQKAVAERWLQVTGKHVTEAYGLTETSPAACINPLFTPWNGTVGPPISSTEVTIRDEDFRELPVNDGTRPVEECTGEICIRGPQVMPGYWHRADETAIALREDWLKTGDIGHVDARGFVTITDRKKDMIIVSGFNVFPNEIEGVVAQHPGVLECGAVGVPDPVTGELVKVVVVKRDPELTAEDVITHCRTALTKYKVPTQVEFRESLPKTPVGKILRRELR